MNDLEKTTGESYGRAVRQVAAWLAPEGMVDALGCQREDYQQELSMVAFEAQAIFRRQKGRNAAYERKYVYKTLWNFARSCMRARARGVAVSAAFTGEMAGWAVFEDVVHCEAQHEAREWARRFAESASAADAALAGRLIDAGGHVPRAYDPERDGTLRTFRRTVDRLRSVAASFR